MSPDITDSHEYPVDRKRIHIVRVSHGLSRFDKYSDGFNRLRELTHDIVAIRYEHGVWYCYICFYFPRCCLEIDLDRAD